MSSSHLIQDMSTRRAALDSIRRLSSRWNWVVPWSEIKKGFLADGEKYLYASKACGIFRPQGMWAALSIRTSVPRSGRITWYRDQSMGELSLGKDSDLLNYDFERDRNSPRNQHLEKAIQEGLPLIYFHGIAPALYQPIAPVWGVSYDKHEGHVSLTATPPPAVEGLYPTHFIETSYSWNNHKSRNHQARFSAKVRQAYHWKCAFSNLPVRELLVDAHIIPDSEGGLATVNNGISMSTLHHTAFDNNLIGIDTEFKVHVSPILLAQDDGKVLDALKKLKDEKIALPPSPADWPNKKFLEQRFETFRASLGEQK